jgi:hypothetical protein
MKRRILLSLLFSGMVSTAVQADWGSFYHGSHISYARNNAWPQPFREMDEQVVRSYFASISHNGWRAHNSLGSEVFRPGDQWLTHAGEERLRRIVQTNPPDRRVIFVSRAETHQITETRVAVVRKALTEMQLDGPETSVVVTDVRPPTSSGAWNTQIHRERVKAMPPPVLPPIDPSANSGP